MRWWGVFAVVGVFAAVLPARADVVVTISKSQQRMSVAVDGSEAHRWLISTGRGRYMTPSGQFYPVRFERDWYSRKYDRAPMPHSIFFYKGYAIHGTTEIASLGRAASHGCVRLHPNNAAVLFRLARAEPQVRIVVTNSALPSVPKPSPLAKPNGRGFEAFGTAMDDDIKPRVETALSAKAAMPKTAAIVARSAQNVEIRPPELADIMAPGRHVATMKIANKTELRAIYKKYGFRW